MGPDIVIKLEPLGNEYFATKDIIRTDLDQEGRL